MKLYQNYLNNFSHVYIENDVLEHPKSKEILSKINNPTIIKIDRYGDIFHRQRQSFNVQKNSQKIILAKKRYDLLYKGSKLCENFGSDNFYYSYNIMNCIFDCEYCYLQGMYQSANVVIFVNTEDYFAEADKISVNKKVYIALSYDSDLLAFEALTGFIKDWVDFAKGKDNILIEIKTKSTNFNNIKIKDFPGNIIFAWSLAPEEIISYYEKKTPSLESRIKVIKEAINKGLKVRLSIEPLMMIENYKNVYKSFIDYLFLQIDGKHIRDINIGSFRMKKEHYKGLRKRNPYNRIFAYPMIFCDSITKYENEKMLLDEIYKQILHYINP